MRWAGASALLAALAGCAGAPRSASDAAPRGCEPGGPVSTVVTGQIGAGVSDEGFVTDNDIDLIIGIQPAATGCR